MNTTLRLRSLINQAEDNVRAAKQRCDAALHTVSHTLTLENITAYLTANKAHIDAAAKRVQVGLMKKYYRGTRAK